MVNIREFVKTKRRTLRNRQRGGSRFREYMSSAGNRIRDTFKNLREIFRGNGNQPVSSQDKINRLRGEMRSGKYNESLFKNMGRNADERTKN